MTPAISVLMPVYNGAKYIGEAIQSVLNQTFTDYELIIINDGSTDHTVAIVNRFKDPRIRLVTQENGGVSSALNRGLSEARAEYIIRFDADDVSYPSRFETQYEFIKNHPEYILVGSDADYMNEEGELIFTYRNIGHSNEELQQTIKRECSFIHSSVIYPRKVVIEAGGYEIKAHTFEDYFLWKKLLSRGKVCNLDDVLMKVRFNASSVTMDEKDHHPRFVELKRKALDTGSISEEEGEELRRLSRSVSRSKKVGSYNRLIAKKFLWDNYKPSRSRVYLLKAIIEEPLNLNGYMLMGLSFLPRPLISKLYKRVKAAK